MASQKKKDKQAFDRLVNKLQRDSERREKEAATKKKWERPGARNVGYMETYYT